MQLHTVASGLSIAHQRTGYTNDESHICTPESRSRWAWTIRVGCCQRFSKEQWAEVLLSAQDACVRYMDESSTNYGGIYACEGSEILLNWG